MIFLLFSFLLIVLTGCGGTTDAESQSYTAEQGDPKKINGPRPVTGFFIHASNPGLLDKIPNGKENDIVYLLKKNSEDGYVKATIAFPKSASSSGAESSASDDSDEEAPILKNIYCFSKTSEMEKGGKDTDCNSPGQVEITYDQSDIEKGYVTKEITIEEGNVGEPDFYGLYTYSKDSENKPTKLAKLHVYTYYEDDFRIRVLNVGPDFFLGKGNFETESKEFFSKAAINIIYEASNYDLRNMQPDGFTKADNYGIDGYLAVRGSQRDDCYDEIIDDIEMMKNDIKDGNKYGMRVAVGLGLPTRDYWTFSKPDWEEEDFSVCRGNGEDGPPYQGRVYQITTVYSTPYGCATGFTNKSVFAKKIGDDWHFKEFEPSEQVVLEGENWTPGRLRDYVNPECNVLMDQERKLEDTQDKKNIKNNQNINFHLGGNGLGITNPIKSGNKVTGYYSLNAYSRNGGGRTGLHEMGHLLGLVDLNDPYYESIGEGNLMHYNDESKGSFLRGRGLPVYDQDVGQNTIEYQWDCLHRISESSCADNARHEFEGGGYVKGSGYSFE